jgi:hypothetical protein
VAARKKNNHFVVTYKDPVEDKIVTLRARAIGDSSLGLAFIRVSDFLFEDQNLVVDPAQEAMKKRFENVECIHLSIYAVISIQEVGPGHAGLRFENDRSNVVLLPGGSGTKHDKK